MTLRVAVIGAGNIATNYHLPGLTRIAADGGASLAAVCDLDSERASKAARRFCFGAAYTDYVEMLEQESPDAVFALVPMTTMREVVGHCLQQGFPTLMEKPPGDNSVQVGELLAIARETGTPHQVAFNRRYAPLLVHMRQLLEESGTAEFLSCQFYRSKRSESRFAYGTGIHGLDALCFLAKDSATRVDVRSGSHESAWVSIEFAGGARAQMEMLPQVGVQSERYAAHAGGRTVVVDGVVGWLTDYPGFLRSYEGGREVVSTETLPQTAREIVSGFYGEDLAFLNSVSAGKLPAPGLDEALRSVLIAEAVDQGKSMEVDDALLTFV